MLAGTQGGGVFMSGDDGVTWEERSNGLTRKTVRGLVATTTSWLAGTWGQGVFRSTDSGNSWYRTDIINPVVLSFAIDSTGRIFAAAGGVYRSTDDGQTWSQNLHPPTQDINSMIALGDSTVLAASQGGSITKTTDGGDTWTEASQGLTSEVTFSLALKTTDLVFAGIDGGVFRSTDQGELWTPVNNGITDTVVHTLLVTRDGIVFAGTESGKIFRSSDDGEVWEEVSHGLPFEESLSLLETQAGTLLSGFIDAGIYRSTTAGDIWTESNSGLRATAIWGIDESEGIALAGTDYHSLFASDDRGTTWERRNAGLDNHDVRDILARANGDILVGTWGSGIYKSTDSGECWSLKNNGIIDKLIRGLAETSSGIVFAGTFGGGVYRSTDDGETWTGASTHLEPWVFTMTVDRNDRVYSGSTRGVYRSTDFGDSWTFIGGLLYVFSIAFNSLGHIYLGDQQDFGVGILTWSTDDGQTWNHTNLPGVRPIYSIVVNEDDFVFVGTTGGVFRSTDQAVSWETVNEGLSNTLVSSLKLSSDGYLYAGTFGNGVFRSVQATTSVEEVGNQIPHPFSLSQNYPNPFNASTAIHFNIPVRTHLRLNVYDVLGRTVAVLLDVG
jgi:photosystem II stability/assembly factor-like uncharacterized protein